MAAAARAARMPPGQVYGSSSAFVACVLTRCSTPNPQTHFKENVDVADRQYVRCAALQVHASKYANLVRRAQLLQTHSAMLGHAINP